MTTGAAIQIEWHSCKHGKPMTIMVVAAGHIPGDGSLAAAASAGPALNPWTEQSHSLTQKVGSSPANTAGQVTHNRIVVTQLCFVLAGRQVLGSQPLLFVRRPVYMTPWMPTAGSTAHRVRLQLQAVPRQLQDLTAGVHPPAQQACVTCSSRF
jgi:hypothetical protein